jgi:hypothetical protein
MPCIFIGWVFLLPLDLGWPAKKCSVLAVVERSLSDSVVSVLALPVLLFRVSQILHAIEGRLCLDGLIEQVCVFEVKFVFALRTEVVEILDDPLADALLVKDVFAGEQNSFGHILIANCAGEVVELVQLLSSDLLQQSHGLGEFLDAKEGVESLLDVGDDFKASDEGQEDKA